MRVINDRRGIMSCKRFQQSMPTSLIFQCQKTPFSFSFHLFYFFSGHTAPYFSIKDRRTEGLAASNLHRIRNAPPFLSTVGFPYRTLIWTVLLFNGEATLHLAAILNLFSIRAMVAYLWFFELRILAEVATSLTQLYIRENNEFKGLFVNHHPSAFVSTMQVPKKARIYSRKIHVYLCDSQFEQLHVIHTNAIKKFSRRMDYCFFKFKAHSLENKFFIFSNHFQNSDNFGNTMAVFKKKSAKI